jgi:hypothetical protein
VGALSRFIFEPLRHVECSRTRRGPEVATTEGCIDQYTHPRVPIHHIDTEWRHLTALSVLLLHHSHSVSEAQSFSFYLTSTSRTTDFDLLPQQQGKTGFSACAGSWSASPSSHGRGTRCVENMRLVAGLGAVLSVKAPLGVLPLRCCSLLSHTSTYLVPHLWDFLPVPQLLTLAGVQRQG